MAFPNGSRRAQPAHVEWQEQRIAATAAGERIAGPDPPGKASDEAPGQWETGLAAVLAALALLLVSAPALVGAVRDLSGPPDLQVAAAAAILAAVTVGLGGAAVSILIWVVTPWLRRLSRRLAATEAAIDRLLALNAAHDAQARDSEANTARTLNRWDHVMTAVASGQAASKRRPRNQTRLLNSSAFRATAAGVVDTRNLRMVPEMNVDELSDGETIVYPATREMPPVMERLRSDSLSTGWRVTFSWADEDEYFRAAVRLIRCIDHWGPIAAYSGEPIDLTLIDLRLDPEPPGATIVRVPALDVDGLCYNEILSYAAGVSGPGAGRLAVKAHGSVYRHLEAQLAAIWARSYPVQLGAIREDVGWTMGPDGRVSAKNREAWRARRLSLPELSAWRSTWPATPNPDQP